MNCAHIANYYVTMLFNYMPLYIYSNVRNPLNGSNYIDHKSN